MVLGECRFCKKTKDLKKSHFVPAAFYTIVKKSDPNQENPIVVTKNVVVQTSKQAQDTLLCGHCEDLFNKYGEKWVLANCWQANGKFPVPAE